MFGAAIRGKRGEAIYTCIDSAAMYACLYVNRWSVGPIQIK